MFSLKMKVVISCVCVMCLNTQSCPALLIPWTRICQVPQYMEFSRQEYWSGLTFPPLGDLPDSGIKRTSLVFPALAGRLFTNYTIWEGQSSVRSIKA